MLSVEDWAEIRRLRRAEQMPIKTIARVMGISRNTVRAAIASDRPPKYERRRAGSIVDAAEPRIRELLRAAEETAPEEVSGRPSVHGLVRDLAATAPPGIRRDAREFAEQLGAAR